MWAVIVYKPNVDREMVLGPFRDEVRAEDWAARIRLGFVGKFGARVEWIYTTDPSCRDALKEGLDDLLNEPEPSMFKVLGLA